MAGSGTYAASNLYTVLSTAAANGVTGTFSGLTVSGNFGNVVPYLIYNANNVQVELTAGNVWAGGTAANDWNTAGNWTGGAVPTGNSTPATSVAAFNLATNSHYQCQWTDDSRDHAVLQHRLAQFSYQC